MVCLKVFVNKSNLNRHTERVHRTPVQPRVDEFDVHRQSGGMNGDDDVQSTSQKKFENVGEQVDVDSQDDDRSMVDRDASNSDGYNGDSDSGQGEMVECDDLRQSSGLNGCGVSRDIFSDLSSVGAVSDSKCDDNDDNQVDVFSQDDDQLTVDRDASDADGSYGDSELSDSGEFDLPEQSGGTKFENDDNQIDISSQSGDHKCYKLKWLYGFWNLEMFKKMKKWSGVKLKKAVPSVIYYLTLMSRALSRDSILKSIMVTADHFRKMSCSPSNYEALGRAVSKRQGVIHDILAFSAEEAEMLSDDDSSDDSEFDIWRFINDILDGENVSGSVRTKRGVELILFYMRSADAWRRDDLYRSICKILKQKVKHMSLQKALKYAISQKKFQIVRMFKQMPGKTGDNDESGSDGDDESESDNDGYEILKKLAPTATDRESESDDDDSDDESKSKSENNDVDKVSGSYNPYVDYYANQARTGQTNPAEKFCPYCALRYSERICPNCSRP